MPHSSSSSASSSTSMDTDSGSDSESEGHDTSSSRSDSEDSVATPKKKKKVVAMPTKKVVYRDDSTEETESLGDSESGDDYYEEEKKESKTRINPDCKPQNLSITRTPTGSDLTEFDTKRGLKASLKRKGSHLRGNVKKMRKLAPGERADTKPATGHVKLHQKNKGKKGGRKHNPNDAHSAHTAGLACMGLPGMHGATVDASPAYNRQHKEGHEKRMLKYPTEEWNMESHVHFEDMESPARLKEIEQKYKGFGLTQKRVAQRAKAYKKKNPEAKAVQSYSVKASSDKKHQVTQNYGRDVDYGLKQKWTRKGYDPDDSSGDDDVTKGHV
jgi:hypothetical protein